MTEPRMSGIGRIAAERRRQVRVEGYGAEHDAGEALRLSLAAASYALPPGVAPLDGRPPEIWPWSAAVWKPGPTQLRDLEKAGALIAAAIDALLAERDAAKGDTDD